MKQYIYLSLGAGKQSSLLAIMICNHDHRVKEYWDAEIVFSDTGGEEDHTYSYLKFLITYCRSDERPNPKKIHIISRDLSLYNYMYQSKKVMLGWVYPLCSSWSKRDNIRQFYRRRHGINGRIYANQTRIIELIGITTDEITRAKPSRVSWLDRRYPFIDLDWSRDYLDAIYHEYNVQVPKKSGCWYCPNKPLSHFLKLRNEYPVRFQMLVDLEDNAEGTPPPTLRPEGSLREIVGKQTVLSDYDWSDQQCDSGYCFT